MSYTPSNSRPVSYDINTPPPPPPKPVSHETSRHGTPFNTSNQGYLAPSNEMLAREAAEHGYPKAGAAMQGFIQSQQSASQQRPQVQAPLSPIQPPIDWEDEHWVPSILRDKTIPDLTHALQTPSLLTSLHRSTQTAHAAYDQVHTPLSTALTTNLSLANSLLSLEAQLAETRAQAQRHLLHLHAMERQWRDKQIAMDTALAPFSPKALYQRLVSAVQEQEQMCAALEESFLEHGPIGEGGTATEREAAEFVRRFREGRKVYYLRKEGKERWDEGRVGGWR